VVQFVDTQQVNCIGNPHANAGYIVVIGRDGGVCIFENLAHSNWAGRAFSHWLVTQHQRLSTFVKIAKPYGEHVAKRDIEWLEWKVIWHVFAYHSIVNSAFAETMRWSACRDSSCRCCPSKPPGMEHVF
jgi:hypothetical protein